MRLKVVLPFMVFADHAEVTRIIVETPSGSFGLLPHRQDCVSAISPGIIAFETEAEGMIFLAVDEGILVKVGPMVLVSVRRAVGGGDLGQLRELVLKQFLDIDAEEREARATLQRLESGLLRRFASIEQESQA